MKDMTIGKMNFIRLLLAPKSAKITYAAMTKHITFHLFGSIQINISKNEKGAK